MALRHPLESAMEAKMKRLLQVWSGVLMALVIVLPASAQDKSAAPAGSTASMLPNVLTGQWFRRLPGQGTAAKLFPVEITFSDRSNPLDIKGSLRIRFTNCAIEDAPFAKASIQGDVFKATVPMPDACAERDPLYYIKGTALSVELKIVNEGGTITAKGKAVNPAPGNQWTYRPVEVSGRL
jgi:hypothetical protein